MTGRHLGAGRGVDSLLVEADSPLHRLPAQVKVVVALVFVVVVVAVPARGWPVLLLAAALVLAAAAVARIPARVLVSRMVVELPFVVFALLMPFVAEGERIDVAGLTLSRSGLIGGALLLAKGTLGVLTAIVLAATTSPRALLAGLTRLRVPATLVGILGFAIRYVSIAGDDLRRAEVARLARGGRPGRLGGLRAAAGSAGATFVRTYERGERVHRAMLARGLSGPVPPLSGPAATAQQWATSLAAPLCLAVVLLVAVAR